MLRSSQLHTGPISPNKLKQYKGPRSLQPSGASSISRDQYNQWRDVKVFTYVCHAKQLRLCRRLQGG